MRHPILAGLVLPLDKLSTFALHWNGESWTCTLTSLIPAPAITAPGASPKQAIRAALDGLPKPSK